MKKLFLAIYLLPFLAFSQATYPLQLKANGVIGNFPNFFIANSNLLNAAVKSGGATNAVKVIQQDGTDVVNPALIINFVGGTNFSVGDAGSGVATVTIPTNAAGSIDWSFTNNLATTNWVSTNFVLQSGLVSSNFVTSANLGNSNYVSYSQLSGSNFLSSSQIASSNFVTAAITNGLAGTNQIVRIIAGTNVVIVTNFNDITINSTGGSGTVTKVSSRAGEGILITGDTNITTAGTNIIEVNTNIVATKGWVQGEGYYTAGNSLGIGNGNTLTFNTDCYFFPPIRAFNSLSSGEIGRTNGMYFGADAAGNNYKFLMGDAMLYATNGISLYQLGSPTASDYRRFVIKSSGTGYIIGSETGGTGVGSGAFAIETQNTNRIIIDANGDITLNGAIATTGTVTVATLAGASTNQFVPKWVVGQTTNGFGFSALLNNTGSYANGFGNSALLNNTGISANGFGHAALQNNRGSYANGFGHAALLNNTGFYANGFGNSALYNNTGSYANGFGNSALRLNNWNNVIGIGHQSTAYFLTNGATVKTIDFANTSTNGYFTNLLHGFGTSGGKINLMYTTTAGTPPVGLVSNTVYQFSVISTNVLYYAGLTNAGSADWTGTLCNSVDINNSIAIGTDVNASKANQTVIGNTSTTETLLRGNVIGSTFQAGTQQGISTTITNMLPGIATNRLVYVGGILVSNVPIAW